MDRFRDRLKTTRIILEALAGGPMRWTPLTKLTLARSSTPWKSQTTLEWLVKEGYVERPTRGVYEITKKGLLFLKALPQTQ
jgi:predicted transcriptional regulator